MSSSSCLGNGDAGFDDGEVGKVSSSDDMALDRSGGRCSRFSKSSLKDSANASNSLKDDIGTPSEGMPHGAAKLAAKRAARKFLYGSLA